MGVDMTGYSDDPRLTSYDCFFKTLWNGGMLGVPLAER